MYEDVINNWPKWHLVEVKGPLKELPCTDPRVERGLSDEIEGKFSLWEKEVPKVGWKDRINASQDCQEVVLECANGGLHPIVVMHVWRDKSEGGVSLEGDCFFISGVGFVIQDLEINGEPMGCQTSHDSVVGCNVVAVTLGLEGLLEDEVAVGMEGNHYILVAGASSHREVAGVAGKELAEQLCYNKNLVGWRCSGKRQNH
jgi:hypothetical protein